jgi:hypothetical protein
MNDAVNYLARLERQGELVVIMRGRRRCPIREGLLHKARVFSVYIVIIRAHVAGLSVDNSKCYSCSPVSAEVMRRRTPKLQHPDEPLLLQLSPVELPQRQRFAYRNDRGGFSTGHLLIAASASSAPVPTWLTCGETEPVFPRKSCPITVKY